MPPWASLPLHLLGISGLLVLATGAGLRISNAESGESPLERSLLACALGLGLLCGIIFLLGIQGLLKPWVLGVLAVALGLWGARPLGGLVRSALQSRQAAPEPWTVFEKTLLLILAAMALSHFLYSYAPPTADDELTYQIALPRLYATAGRFVSTPDNMASFYPLNAQLLYAAVLSVGNALSVKTLLWAFGMLVLAAIWILGRRRLGMSRAAALLAVTLFAVMPYTTSLSGVTSSDFMDVFVELMAFNVLFMAAPASGRRVILAGILGGVGMGTRPYAGAWVVAMAVLLCLRDRRWQEAALFLGVSALVFSPWPLRNGVLTGNPFYPKAFWPGAAEDPFLKFQAASTRAVFWKDVRNLPMFLASGGLIWGMGVPSLALAPWALADQPHRKEWRQIFIFMALVIVLTFGFPIRNTRYFGQVFPFFALSGAAGFDLLSGSISRWARRALYAWLLMALLVPNVLMSLYWGARRVPFFIGRQSWEGYLQENYTVFEGYPMLRFILSHLEPGSRILVVGSIHSPSFYYPDMTLYCMAQIPPAAYSLPTEGLADAIARKKIGYLLMIKKGFIPVQGRSVFTYLPGGQLSLPALAPPFFQPVYESDLSVLYKVFGKMD